MSGPTPSIATKQQFIDYTTANWHELVAYLDGLTEVQWLGPQDSAGWSVKDHVSHLTRWDRAEIELLRNGVPVQQTAGISDAVWNSGSGEAMNEEIRQSASADSIEQVKTDRDAAWRDLVVLMNGLTEEHMRRHGGEAEQPDANLFQILAAYLGSHYTEHLAHLKTFVD
jgi:hypothetical protein